MKKTYIQPAFEVIVINSFAPLMAGSDLGVAGRTLDADQALGRGFSFSDDDVEEE